MVITVIVIPVVQIVIVVVIIIIAMIAIIIVIVVMTRDDSRTIPQDPFRDTRIAIPREDRLLTILVTALTTHMHHLRTTVDQRDLRTLIRLDEHVGRGVVLVRRWNPVMRRRRAHRRRVAVIRLLVDHRGRRRRLDRRGHPLLRLAPPSSLRVPEKPTANSPRISARFSSINSSCARPNAISNII